ncbi:hypothetical protein GLU60_01340 [Nanohaloarchaea archaeon H01]|nr:hypothetical protein [Nanohaloarchaea archaeon H01]
MVLERLSDGASGHSLVPDEDARKLIFILCLPLVDGVFATLLVTGAVETFSDIVAVGLTVFAGAGALAVLYSASKNRQEAVGLVKQAAPYLILGAVLVSLVAPIYEQLFYISRLRYAAGLALLTIAMKMGGIKIADKLSVPAILITGLMLSVRNPGSLAFSLNYVAPAVATVTVALAALYGASRLNVSRMDLNYIRKGGALVLTFIALSMYGLEIPSELGLAVFALSVVASYRN